MNGFVTRSLPPLTETSNMIDIDFTNFDICDGEFSFSELLLDFDLDNEGILNPSTSAEVQRYSIPVFFLSVVFRFLVFAKLCMLRCVPCAC